MNIYYCPVQTFAGRMFEDPEPPGFCWNEVENEGDLCPEHDDGDDDFDYDRYLEEKAEREADPDYYTDHENLWGDE